MNKMLLGLLVSASVVAHAQTSSTSLSTTAAPAGQTSAVTATEAAPKAASKFSVPVLLGVIATESGLRTGEAIGSANYIGLNYKMSETWTLGLRHNFSYDLTNASGDGYSLIDPEVQFRTKAASVLGSAPTSLAYRVYLPVSEGSRTSKCIAGLRLDASTEWALNPKWTAGIYLSPRYTVNNNNSVKDGSDDVARMIASPSLTYNFNDAINAYYAPAVDYASVTYVRGDVSPRANAYPYPNGNGAWNAFNHEVGANFTVGKVSINPAVVNYVNLSTGKGHAQAEYMEYDLNLSATF